MYEVNGTPLLLLPKRGRWVSRKQIGSDGQNRPIYEPTRSFELTWSPMSHTEYCQLCEWFEEVSQTGSHVMVLPDYCGCSYTGTLYSGVIFQEPTNDGFWQEHLMNVKLKVINIRTSL